MEAMIQQSHLLSVALLLALGHSAEIFEEALQKLVPRLWGQAPTLLSPNTPPQFG